MITKWYVRAFDTDYGFDTIWEFATEREAQMWKEALLFDFGNECQAFVFSKSVAKVD